MNTPITLEQGVQTALSTAPSAMAERISALNLNIAQVQAQMRKELAEHNAAASQSVAEMVATEQRDTDELRTHIHEIFTTFNKLDALMSELDELMQRFRKLSETQDKHQQEFIQTLEDLRRQVDEQIELKRNKGSLNRRFINRILRRQT